MHIGHNHGLFQFGFEAKDVGDPAAGLTQNGSAPFQQQPDSYWVQWEKLAAALASLPPSIQTILVVLLPKVGAVAGLAPGSSKRSEGYADFYQPGFLPSPNILSGKQVQTADQTIKDIINPRIRQIVTDAATVTGTAGRVKFLNAWSLFEAYDYKNTLEPDRRIPIGHTNSIDNKYLNGTPPLINLPCLPGNRLAEGGFQSIDGMHPTGAGYAVLAAEAMKVLGLLFDREDMFQTAFNEDTLLSQYPPQLDYLGTALHLLRNAQHADHFAPNPLQPLTDDSHVVDVLHAMTSLFHP